MDESSFIALSPLTRKILEKMKQAVSSDLPLLLLGESGTGKSHIGFAFYSLCKERFPQYQSYDFSISESEEEVGEFFTKLDGKGGSIIFLEGVSNLGPNFQVQLLQKIRNEKGKNRYLLSDNPDFAEKVKSGQVQESLFVEIQTLQVRLPTLRDRKEDIPAFTRLFLELVGKRYNRKNIKISEKLGRFLLEYDYPGNLHQLRNLLEGMVSMHNVKTLDTKHLPPELFETGYRQNSDLSVRTGIPLRDYEREIIRRNLILVNGNREKAARILGISERTIYRKITEFELFDSQDGKTPPSS
ncbi:sigma-54-dependent Fis family transcriptional regulator [Leptospira semungkisensis]|uniref:Sigma-54-dependent Fis family transcriptional regulator n=1 Tax=Leptospira semungkisensis TaxID=2484985 RepID=A0A4R9G6D1_9LEPT|nr:helix-turn-helix domain-containing protein [Leptospira semungkisensis]TGK07156.1 sigma-54-dependent Fis family transcriptional regulator [Leptospira semungkisensis]